MPTLEITTVAACTVRCTYCPQDRLAAAYKGGPHRLMLPEFVMALSSVPRDVRIDFSGFVEPWLNPMCTDMLYYALLKGYSMGVYTTLQGMTEPEVVVDILTANADRVEVVCLHLPDAHGNMTGHAANATWRHALETMLRFRDTGTIKRFEVMTMSADGDLSHVVPLERLTAWVGVDRAGALDRSTAGPSVESPVHHDVVSCSYTPFYDQNVMLPNGDVVLCCNDYGLQHKLGNLLVDRWEDLDRGKMLEMNARADTDTICKRCTRATPYRTTTGNRQTWVTP